MTKLDIAKQIIKQGDCQNIVCENCPFLINNVCNINLPQDFYVIHKYIKDYENELLKEVGIIENKTELAKDSKNENEKILNVNIEEINGKVSFEYKSTGFTQYEVIGMLNKVINDILIKK